MVTNDYNYSLFLENGTELNLSLINEEINIDIYLLVKNKEIANFYYSKYFYEQGYDIYDKKSRFYNDFCTPAFLGKNDITLEDRKKYIYPNNITLCKSNCKYKKIDIKEERIICLCSINSFENVNNEENDFLNEDDVKFISYLLDKINYKIFQCYKVIISLDNLKDNLALYIILLAFFPVITLNLIFLFYSLPKLRKSMYNNAPTPDKVKNEVIRELKKQRKLRENATLNPRKEKKRQSMITLRKLKIIKTLTKNDDITNSIKDILINFPSSEQSMLKLRKKIFIVKLLKMKIPMNCHIF